MLTRFSKRKSAGILNPFLYSIQSGSQIPAGLVEFNSGFWFGPVLTSTVVRGW
jgi:hypothetical protein